MNKKELIQELFEIDFTLTMFEDWMHGEDGDECTKTRIKLSQVIEFLEKNDNID